MTKIPRTELTATRRERLARLATKLESLPADYKHFKMSVYVEPRRQSRQSKDNERRIKHYAQYNGGVDEIGCGTSACAIGHGPSAGIFVPKSCIRKSYWGREDVVSWEEYRFLFTGEGNNCGDIFSWLFSGGWNRADNSHYGAAARIRYLLDKMEIPENYYGPAKRFVPLYESYRVFGPQTLPVDFYTPSMLDQMLQGTIGVAKEEDSLLASTEGLASGGKGWE